MNTHGWRERLAAAVKADGRSMRALSLALGGSEGYVHSILKDEKEPGIERLLALCEVLNVSPAYILLGLDVSPEGQRLIAALRGNRERIQAALALIQDEADG